MKKFIFELIAILIIAALTILPIFVFIPPMKIAMLIIFFMVILAFFRSFTFDEPWKLNYQFLVRKSKLAEELIQVKKHQLIELETKLQNLYDTIQTKNNLIERQANKIVALKYPELKSTWEKPEDVYYLSLHNGKDIKWYWNLMDKDGKYVFTSKGYSEYAVAIIDIVMISRLFSSLIVYDVNHVLKEGESLTQFTPS
jgi:hypothetical protein